MSHIVIIGCGIAGDEAAFSARKENPSVQITIITKEKQPLYSACVFADYISDEISRERVQLKSPEEYKRSNIELIVSQSVCKWQPDKKTIDLEKRTITYDKLILATGSRTFLPPVPGIEMKGVYGLKTLKDADAIKEVQGKAAVVIGSGPVGIEVAVALKQRGWNVSIVEMLDRILPRLFDSTLAGSIGDILSENDIQVFTNEKVLEIVGDATVTGIKTDRRALEAQLVVVVAGMIPEVDMVIKGGVKLGASGGISVDETMKTSLADVWACGDCVETRNRITGRTGLFMLWDNARLTGRTAGINAAGGDMKYSGSVNITTLYVFDKSIASVGFISSDLTEENSKTFHRKGPFGELFLVFKDNSLVGVQAIGRTERVGDFIGLLLQGGDLRKYLDKNLFSKLGLERRALRGMEESLRKLLKV